MKYKYQALSFLFAVGLVISLIISLTPTPVICRPSEGCDTVLSSVYASTFGIKNSYFGLIGFTILLLSSYSHIKNNHHRKKQIIHSGVIIGSAMALYFIYLQITVLKAFCKYCLVVDLSLLIALAIILLYWKK